MFLRSSMIFHGIFGGIGGGERIGGREMLNTLC